MSATRRWVLSMGQFLLLGAMHAYAAGNPAPGPIPTDPATLPQTLGECALIVLDLSWDFGDIGSDWRKELTSTNATERFIVRWRYTGPEIASAALAVYDVTNGFLGEIALSLTPTNPSGIRYATMQIGDLPGVPTVTMRVRVKNSEGEQLGCASNEAQISAPAPEDPFLYTPLFMMGLATDCGVPAIVGGVSCENRFAPPDVGVYCDGVRAFDGGKGVIASTDRWGLGSCTKSMTCTLLGILIQDGAVTPGTGGPLTWDTPLSDLFPEWQIDMNPRFFSTTLRHLACHRSGLRMTGSEDKETRVVGGANDDPQQFRRDMTERLLKRQHYEMDTNWVETTTPTQIGVDFLYGSGNFIVLAAVIERLLNTSYEQAIQARLFQPLGISTAGFGLPAVTNQYQPHGHYRHPDFPHNMVRDNMVCPPIWNGAGSAYMSIEDWLKYLRLHIDGREGSLVLSEATLATLHTPYPKAKPDDPSYGFGWLIDTNSGAPILDHDGTYFRFFSRCQVYTATGIAVCAVANLGPNKNAASAEGPWQDKSCFLAVNTLLWHLIEKAKAKQAQGDPLPAGYFAAGSAGALGFLHLQSPGDPPNYVAIDRWPGGPLPQLSMEPADYAPVSFYQHDAYYHAVAAYLRRPKAMTFAVPAGGVGPLLLQASTEKGAVYQLWRAPGLMPHDAPTLVRAAEAPGTEMTFEINPQDGAINEVFWVSDLME